MWFNILKRLKTKGKSSLTGFKIEDVNEERPDVEEDNCNRQLKEYADKIKNTYTSSKFIPSPHKLGIYKAYNTEYGNSRLISMTYDGYRAHYWVEFRYAEVPENVACKALKFLKDNKVARERMNNNRYDVALSIKEENNNRTYTLTIYNSGIPVVDLGIIIGSGESYPDISNIDIDWR